MNFIYIYYGFLTVNLIILLAAGGEPRKHGFLLLPAVQVGFLFIMQKGINDFVLMIVITVFFYALIIIKKLHKKALFFYMLSLWLSVIIVNVYLWIEK